MFTFLWIVDSTVWYVTMYQGQGLVADAAWSADWRIMEQFQLILRALFEIVLKYDDV